jgi:hypothetical protein
MWVRLPLPDIETPIRGFTFPEQDRLFVLNPSGLVEVILSPKPAIRVVADPQAAAAAYDLSTAHLNWKGCSYPVHGEDGGDVTFCEHPNGDHLVVDPHEDALLIMDSDEQELRQEVDDFFVSEGVWTVAGFSGDFKWLVVCDPDELRVFRLQKPA